MGLKVRRLEKDLPQRRLLGQDHGISSLLGLMWASSSNSEEHVACLPGQQQLIC